MLHLMLNLAIAGCSSTMASQSMWCCRFLGVATGFSQQVNVPTVHNRRLSEGHVGMLAQRVTCSYCVQPSASCTVVQLGRLGVVV
jgi:hypothetical protein